MSKHIRVNNEIRAREVRVIDPNGNQLGIMDIQKARQLAEDMGLDLVEISPEAKPPVCKILDFGKYRFEQSKKIKEAKKKQKIVLTKEIRLRPKIEEHDYNTKLKQAIGFLEKGYKVKLSIRFKGRELAHKDIGREIIERFINDVGEYGTPDFKPKFESRVFVTVISPKKK
ncbi:MAG: translation initiation factor IF-3 [Spirochaetes bacterium]|nr:MAG: translation initiation factor IF-3 [Spirochaetota bacterium]RKY01672.1 MAG: translation initiation factor IF-3 [Spirochaetota bacterium]